MNESKLYSLAIDQDQFKLAFGRDVDFHDPYPISTYLDRVTGNIDWVWKNDEDAEGEGIPAEDNQKLCEQIKATPNRYLELPGLSHGDHHTILKEFLATECPEDSQGDYFSSIGGWIKSQEDERIVASYYDFRYRKILQRGETFLQQHGVKPQWKA